MKVKKTGFIVLLCLAIVCVAGALAMFFFPTGSSPIVMSEKIGFTTVGGHYEWTGKIKNNTSEDITLTSYDFEVRVDTAGNVINVYGYLYWFCDDQGHTGEITLAPGEEFALSSEEFVRDGETPTRVMQVSVSVDGYRYYLIGDPAQQQRNVIGVILCILAAIFAIGAIANLVSGKKRVSRAQSAERIIAQLPNGGAYLSGFYTEKGAGKKAAAKSSVSILGGALSAIFLGVGFYKVYSGSTPKEFILTDTELLVGDTKSKEFYIETMASINKESFPAPSITTNKKQVVLSSADGSRTYLLNAKDSGLTVDELAEKVEKIFHDEPTANTAAPTSAPESENANIDPFAN